MRAVDIWRVDPAATGLQYVHDAADNPPVIDPRLASCVGRQKWSKPTKLIFRQPETIAIIEGLLSETVNHIFPSRGIFMGPDPKPRIVIICEGRLTEPDYLYTLARHCGALVSFDVIVEKGADPPPEVVRPEVCLLASRRTAMPRKRSQA